MHGIANRGRKRGTAKLAAAAVVLLAVGVVAPAGRAAQDDLTLISIAQVVPGGKANAFSGSASVSADGQFVAFGSQATNLVAEDTNGDDDVYVRDTVAGTTTLITPGDGPNDGNGFSPVISDDGQRVAFVSSDQLTGDDTNSGNDAYVYDFGTDSFELVSRPSGAGPGGTVGTFSSIAISGNGNSVAFSSQDNTLDPANDTDVSTTGIATDVFVRDLDTDTTELVSRNDTIDGNSASLRPSLDFDGSHVGFDTTSDNLSPDDGPPDTLTDVYVFERATEELTLVSRADSAAGAKGDGNSLGPSLSADGNEIAFMSVATTLDTADTDAAFDVYVRDVQAEDTELISRATGAAGAKADQVAQAPTISADGAAVAFISSAGNLDPESTPGINQAYVRNRDTDTTRLESRADGLNGAVADEAVAEPAISSDGSALAFPTRATNLDPADTDEPPGLIQDVYVRNVSSGETQLVSQSPAQPPVNANGESRDPAVSANGRYVAFTSDATNIDPDATDNQSDIFRFDTETGEAVLVSRADGPDGAEGNGRSELASISADGQYVAFKSEAENLVGDDGDNLPDIFVRDLVNGTTTLVSRGSGGGNIAGFPDEPSISSDGMRVAFDVDTPYVSDDNNGLTDVYVRDLETDTTILVSRAEDGTDAGGGDSRVPDISADGESVAFTSDADDLTSDGSTPVQQVFVRRLDTDETVLASRADGATGAIGNAEAREPSISGDGSTVAFQSDSDTLDPAKPGTTTQVFVRDLDALQTDVVSRASDGSVANRFSNSPELSDDGTYVAFQSDATNLDPAANNDDQPDVYHRDLAAGETVLVSRAAGAGGAEGDNTSDDPSISEHGRFVAFDSNATNLDPLDTDATADVYLRDVLGADTTAPVTTIATGPPEGSVQNTATASFTFTVDEPGSTSECRMDGDAFEPCAGSFDTPALADGAHTFEVRSIDRTGNVETPAASRTFTVDTVAPDTTLTEPVGPISDSTPTVGFTSSEPGSTFECSLDGAAFSGCDSGITLGPLADGDHTFAVRATDPAGNLEASPAQVAFTVDTAAPDTSLVDPPEGLIADSTPTFSFTATEPGSGFRCALDGAEFTPCDPGVTLGPLTDGDHTLAVRAVDPAGNPDATPAETAFTVDTAITGREVSAKAKQKQGKTVKVVAKLATGEGVTATLTGTVTTGKDLELREVTQTVPAGEGRKLVAKLKKKDNRDAVDRLEDGKLKTKIEVTVTDAAGNSETTKVTVKLKD